MSYYPYYYPAGIHHPIYHSSYQSKTDNAIQRFRIAVEVEAHISASENALKRSRLATELEVSRLQTEAEKIKSGRRNQTD